MSHAKKKQFNDGQFSYASQYEIIVLFNQLSGFDVEVDTLLAKLIPLLQSSEFVNAELPLSRFSNCLQHLVIQQNRTE
ncbi:MAG: hypothetical protein CL600_09990 [Alteromonas sp.]|jgi:hypothetical protein|nr:hypothetical protein [Alteromonas sp.]